MKNSWIFLGVVLGIWCRGWSFIFSSAMVLIPAFFLWHWRMMGAGDGKVMALTAGFLGLPEGIYAIWTGLCVGAVWSICRFWHDKSFRARLTYFFAYIMRAINYGTMEQYDNWSEQGSGERHRIPLAVCMAAGVYLYLFLKQIPRIF